MPGIKIMLAPYRFACPFLALAIFPVVASHCEAQTYSDAERHFSIELPNGWQVMSKSEVDQINGLVGGRFMSGGVRYDGGLRKKSARFGGFPYVLIQSMPGPASGASFEEIEKSLSVDLRAPIKDAQGRMGDLLHDLKIGQPVLDRKSKCVILQTQSSVQGVGAAKGLSMGHLGKNHVVFIHCYSKAEDFEACLQTFKNINDWFSFDRGYDFKPGTGSVGLFSWQGAGRGGMIGGAIGLMVGLASYFFRLISQTGTSKGSVKGTALTLNNSRTNAGTSSLPKMPGNWPE